MEYCVVIIIIQKKNEIIYSIHVYIHTHMHVYNIPLFG